AKVAKYQMNKVPKTNKAPKRQVPKGRNMKERSTKTMKHQRYEGTKVTKKLAKHQKDEVPKEWNTKNQSNEAMKHQKDE
ncbi:24703_t:CDS:2, partial [Gigaspora margarita]